MFTGLIESVGRVAEVKPVATGLRLRLATALAGDLQPGDSLAVNGVCLTVVAAVDGEVHTDISPETARITAIGLLKPDSLVNLERPLRADARVGGHFVQGHVDATGGVDEIRQDGDCYWLTVRFPSLLQPYIIHKGSIAVDGVSLTVAGLGEHRFDVQIVPYTWAQTNLCMLKSGDTVNLECDILGKYVVRAIELGAFGLSHNSRTTH
jgi:riboflavin synthase alpha subunit